MPRLFFPAGYKMSFAAPVNSLYHRIQLNARNAMKLILQGLKSNRFEAFGCRRNSIDIFCLYKVFSIDEIQHNLLLNLEKNRAVFELWLLITY